MWKRASDEYQDHLNVEPKQTNKIYKYKWYNPYQCKTEIWQENLKVEVNKRKCMYVNFLIFSQWKDDIYCLSLMKHKIEVEGCCSKLQKESPEALKI